jgi:hypothetical protein
MQSALWICQQAQAELGLPRATQLVQSLLVTDQQMLALMNAAGSELVNYYPWEDLNKEWILQTEAEVGAYDLPYDWAYFVDQSQWDRSNHWPLLGPKTPQEWQWIKGGLISQGPRLRYRIQGRKYMIWPVPGAPDTGTATPWTLASEYISKNWVATGQSDAEGVPIYTNLITSDLNFPVFDEWLMVKFLKLKFWETKGFDTTAFRDDFINLFFSLTGKNMGAPVLTMSPRPASIYIGPNNIPDGSWPVGSTS